jgi:uncharacterized protein YcnI
MDYRSTLTAHAPGSRRSARRSSNAPIRVNWCESVAEGEGMKRYLAASLVCVAFALVVLDAHVVVTPRESTAGAEQTYTVRVPTEGTVSSTSIELEIPAGLHVMQVATGEGFSFEVKKDGDRVVAITWKREIKPKEFALFTFTAHNPQPGALQWQAHQTFADGSMRHWVGERGTKEPASVTTIVAKGAPAAAPADPAHKHP